MCEHRDTRGRSNQVAEEETRQSPGGKAVFWKTRGLVFLNWSSYGNSGQDISPLWGRVLATAGRLPSLTPLPIAVTTQVPKFNFQTPLLLGDPAGQYRRMPSSGLGSWALPPLPVLQRNPAPPTLAL